MNDSLWHFSYLSSDSVDNEEATDANEKIIETTNNEQITDAGDKIIETIIDEKISGAGDEIIETINNEKITEASSVAEHGKENCHMAKHFFPSISACISLQ